MKKFVLGLTVYFVLTTVFAEAKPLQVFILAGQSNMQGHAQVRTFEHIGMDPATKPMLAEMQNADGTPKVCERVWISSLGSADTVKTGKLTADYGARAAGAGERDLEPRVSLSWLGEDSGWSRERASRGDGRIACFKKMNDR